jgi:hypothetical protein
MRGKLLWLGVTSGALFALSSCSANTSSGRVFDNTGGGGSNGAGQTSGGGSMSTGDGGGDIGFDGGPAGTGSGGGTGNDCNAGQNEDHDKDGFTIVQGDCNDCDPNVNPGAIEVIATASADGGVPMPADEDCDGKVDNVLQACDGALALDDPNPMHGAFAVDLCQQATMASKKWGVIDAQYVRADGTPFAPGLQVGIEDGFGPNVHPQGGKRLLAISSGHARTINQPGACGSLTCTANSGGNPPPGFPQDVPNCAGDKNINDDVGLEVKLRAPTNATGYSFNFFFYSFEYPEWVCTSFNDQFIALVAPPPMGSINGNISFDSKNNPVSVNIAFFNVCAGCPLGTGELQGTGFDVWNDAGGTSWLLTQAPVKGGDLLSIRFAIWDTGDQAWDSTALVDNFQWVANGGTVTVNTNPLPMPK